MRSYCGQTQNYGMFRHATVQLRHTACLFHRDTEVGGPTITIHYLSTYLLIYPTTNQPTNPPMSQPTNLPIIQPNNQCTYQSINQPSNLSIYLPIYLSVYLSVYLSIHPPNQLIKRNLSYHTLNLLHIFVTVAHTQLQNDKSKASPYLATPAAGLYQSILHPQQLQFNSHKCTSITESRHTCYSCRPTGYSAKTMGYRFHILATKLPPSRLRDGQTEKPHHSSIPSTCSVPTDRSAFHNPNTTKLCLYR